MSESIENRTYDEIHVGDSATLVRTVSQQDLLLFASLSGDCNPAHLDAEYAQQTPFGGVIAHGLFTGALLSSVLGMQLPGPGTIYLGQTLRFLRPVRPGDTLTVMATVREKFDEKKRLLLDCKATNQDGKTVLTGEAEVIAPSERVCRPRMALPAVRIGD